MPTKTVKSEETVVYSASFKVELKTITVELRKNNRGNFLRIDEEKNGRVERVMIPDSGIRELREALQNVEGRI